MIELHGRLFAGESYSRPARAAPAVQPARGAGRGRDRAAPTASSAVGAMPRRSMPRAAAPLATFGTRIESQVVARHQRLAGQHSISLACTRPSAVGQRRSPAADARPAASQPHQLLQRVDARPGAFVGLADAVAPVARRATMALGHVLDPHRLKARDRRPPAAPPGPTPAGARTGSGSGRRAPKITDGRNTVRSSPCRRSTASPAALLRR